MRISTHFFGRPRSGGVLATFTALALGACFPKLPPEDDAAIADATDTAEDAAPNDDTGPRDVPVSIDVVDRQCESPNDCESLVGVCQQGACTDNRCVVTNASDDGDRCTDGDICTAGTCVGMPKVCEAVSQCHKMGECEAATGNCTTPTKLDGTGCDDGTFCTLTDTCRVGICSGAGRPLPVDHSMILVSSRLDGGKDLTLSGLVSTQSSTWAAIWATGPIGQYYSPDSEVGSDVLDLIVGGCELSLVRWSSPTSRPTAFRLGGYPEACPANRWVATALGAEPLRDDSIVIGGLISGVLPLANGRARALGESTMGNAHRSSFWVARVDAAGETLWTVEAQGFLGQSFADLEIPYRTLSTNRTNGIAFAVPMFGNANAAELVDGVGVGVSVTPITGDAGSVIYDLDVSGRIQERARVSAAPGAAIISALRLLDDRRIVVSGLVGGGVLNIQSKNGSTTQVPTGIGGEALEPWIAMLNADGTVQWSWHIFVRPSFSGPSPNDPTVKALPFIIPQGENGLLFPVFSGKPIDGRPGTGMASPLSPTWPETAGFRTTLIELDSNTGALNRSVLLQSTQSIATAGTVFRNNAYIAGVIDGSATSTWNVFVPSGNSLARPFVLGVDRWAEVVATSQTDDPLVEPYDAILQPLLSANSEAIFVGYQTEVAFRTLDRDNGVSVNRPAIVVRRLNENSALDCE